MATATKSSAKRYGAAASKSVAREMEAFKEGTHKTSSGQKVTNPKQAIAIGLSEARHASAKVPIAPRLSAKKAVSSGKEHKVAVKKARPL